MKKLFIVHGLKRSGNHAIISWLQAHEPRALFFNNLIPIAPILKAKADYPPPMPFEEWLKKKFPNALSRYLQLFGRAMIVSLEDIPLLRHPFTSIPVPFNNILIVRDPRNLFASRIRLGWPGDRPREVFPNEYGPDMQRVVNLWKDHAREVIGESTHLDNKICVYFDTWFSNVDYRRAVSHKSGLKFTDRGLNQISEKGGGSSFDKTAFQNRSQSMDVLNRHEQLTDPEHTLLTKILEDEEVGALGRKVAEMHDPLKLI